MGRAGWVIIWSVSSVFGALSLRTILPSIEPVNIKVSTLVNTTADPVKGTPGLLGSLPKEFQSGPVLINLYSSCLGCSLTNPKVTKALKKKNVLHVIATTDRKAYERLIREASTKRFVFVEPTAVSAWNRTEQIRQYSFDKSGKLLQIRRTD